MKFQKVTTSPRAGHGRWYDDACGTAFAMEVIGERWALVILRELLLGARRFSDLRAAMPGISAKVLTERLASLEDAGVLHRRKLPPPASAQVYELTEWGLRAEPAIMELGRWAAMSGAHDVTLPLSPVSLMLSFRTMFQPDRAAGMTARIGFDIAGEQLVANVADGALTVGRGSDGAAALFRAPAATVIAALVYGEVPPETLEREAGLAIEGDRALALSFAKLFALPPKLT